MANAFLEKQKAMQQACLDIGMETGFQKCWDIVQICLRDPEVVGKDTFGRERLARLYMAMRKYDKELCEAWSSTPESDVKQRDLDSLLGEIWKDELVPFHKRYPALDKPDYNKKWRQK